MTNDEKLTANAVIADTLDKATATDSDLLVVTCDSRGSAGLVPFTNAHPDRTVKWVLLSKMLLQLPLV